MYLRKFGTYVKCAFYLDFAQGGRDFVSKNIDNVESTLYVEYHNQKGFSTFDFMPPKSLLVYIRKI
jgi:hypothetical protein